MANGVYNKGKYLAATGGISASTDLRCLLLNTTGTFDQTHNTVSQISANEITGGSYARYDIGNITVTEDDTNHFAYIDGDDAVFTAVPAGQTVGAAVVYVYNAADASANLVAFYDLTDTPGNGGNITVQWATPANGGILKFA